MVLEPLHSNANNPSGTCTYSKGGYKNPSRQFYAKCNYGQETLDYHGNKDRSHDGPNMVEFTWIQDAQIIMAVFATCAAF
jgi:hypothetical protein